MRCLYVDLASHDGLLACVSDDDVLADPVDHRLQDHELVPKYEVLLERAGWNAEDITHLACVTGPGGFTSLRVAVSFVNALGYALDIPSAGIHLSDIYAARMPPPRPSPTGGGWRGAPGGGFLWLHSTKKTLLFLRGFGESAELAPEPICISVDEAASRIPSHAQWAGELLPEHREALASREIVPAELRPTEDVLPSLLQSLSYKQQTILPWYGRDW